MNLNAEISISRERESVFSDELISEMLLQSLTGITTLFSIVFLYPLRTTGFDGVITPIKYDTNSFPWAVGITDECIVYEYREGISWAGLNQSQTRHRCTDYEVFLIQYQNKDDVTMTMAIAVRKVGPRLEIQNAMSGKKVFDYDNGSAYIFRQNYRETFLTNSLPAGYVFHKVFQVDYKVYALVRTKTDFRFHRLKLIMRDVNAPKFYLTSSVRLDPVLFPPSPVARVLVLDVSPSIDTINHESEYESRLRDLIACRSFYKPMNLIKGIVLHFDPLMKGEDTLYGSLISISALRRGKAHCHYLPRVNLFARESGADFCDMRSYSDVLSWEPAGGKKNSRTNIYYLSRPNITTGSISDSLEKLVFKKKLFNPYNFHSRMAYPHAVYYNPLFNRDLLAFESKSLLPLFIGTSLGIFLLSKATFVILKCAFMMYHGIFRQSVGESVRKYKGKA